MSIISVDYGSITGGGVDISDIIGVEILMTSSNAIYGIYTVGINTMKVKAGTNYKVNLYTDSSATQALQGGSNIGTTYVTVDVSDYNLIYMKNTGATQVYITVLS